MIIKQGLTNTNPSTSTQGNGDEIRSQNTLRAVTSKLRQKHHLTCSTTRDVVSQEITLWGAFLSFWLIN